MSESGNVLSWFYVIAFPIIIVLLLGVIRAAVANCEFKGDDEE